MNEGMQMSGEEGWRWGEGERRVVDVAVWKTDCEAPSPLSPIYVFLVVYPSPSPSPRCLPLLHHASFPSSTCSTFTLSLSFWLPPPCPLTLALPLAPALLHFFKCPINWLMCSAVQHLPPGVPCRTVGMVSFHSVKLCDSVPRTMTYLDSKISRILQMSSAEVHELQWAATQSRRCRKLYHLWHSQFVWLLWWLFQALMKSYSDFSQRNVEEL